VCIDFDLRYTYWEKTERIIEHDVHSYYGYLPALFIFNDIKLEKDPYQYGENLFYFWPVINESGKSYFKMTCGQAILYSPFFFAAHLYAINSDYPATGFSPPYVIFLLIGAIFYLIIGLYVVKEILMICGFSDTIISLVILILGLGTNLFCYSTNSAAMPHLSGFALFALFVFYTIKWHKIPQIKYTIALGLLLGIISLVRPSNIILLLFFVFYGIKNWSDLKLKLFKHNYLIIFSLCVFIVWIPQFIYWKLTTGEYITYSYQDEGFFYLSPKILSGLFSFRKGWLVYTPLMIMALAGIYFLNKDEKTIAMRLPILVFLIVNIYIVFSWWCWWYGGSFGQRSLIESYAMLAIPLAAFIRFIMIQKLILKTTALIIILFFIFLNLFQTHQFEQKILHWDGMTRNLYFRQFLRMRKIDNYDKYINWIDYNEAKQGNR
jgi:hypothetical protein